MDGVIEILFRIMAAALIVVAVLIAILIAICIAVIVFICKGMWLGGYHFFHPHPEYIEAMP